MVLQAISSGNLQCGSARDSTNQLDNIIITLSTTTDTNTSVIIKANTVSVETFPQENFRKHLSLVNPINRICCVFQTRFEGEGNLACRVKIKCASPCFYAGIKVPRVRS